MAIYYQVLSVVFMKDFDRHCAIGLNQGELANAVGITVQALAKMEGSGKRTRRLAPGHIVHATNGVHLLA